MTHDEQANSEELLRIQREANEKLVVGWVRASDEADEAMGAQRLAEDDATELRVHSEQLRVTAEFRERLIGIVGHDLRSPLNTMVMAGGLLIAGGNLGAADARLAARIVTSGHRMGRMIGQLVEFTRARLGGGFDLQRSSCDLGEICLDITEELRLSSSTQIRHTVEGDVQGIWDADRLAEAISNIASNAVDHAAPGTPVLIHVRDEGGTVVAEITNQGACIPPELLPTIFTAFRRLHGPAHSVSGHLGLGLYVACEVVRAHDGQLDVRSSEGSTTFTLRVPRASTQ